MRAEERKCKGALCLQNSLSQQPVCFQSRPVHELQPQTYTLQEEISLSMAPTWSEKGRRQTKDSTIKVPYSLTWLKSLQFVTSGALLQNKTTLCDTWVHTKRLLKHYVLVGDAFHIHNEEINQLCLKSLLTQRGVGEVRKQYFFPQKQPFIKRRLLQKHVSSLNFERKWRIPYCKSAFKWLVIALIMLWFVCRRKVSVFYLALKSYGLSAVSRASSLLLAGLEKFVLVFLWENSHLHPNSLHCQLSNDKEISEYCSHVFIQLLTKS